MSLFALPILPAALPPPPRTQFSSHITNSRKRKRAASPTPSLQSDEDDDKPFNDDDDHASLPAASTNPLSLRPSEIIQYRLAGLELDEELPSKKIKDFPHRPLPPDRDPPPIAVSKSEKKRSRDEGFVVSFADKEEEITAPQSVPEKQQRHRGPRLRLQHLGVLNTIIHKCLQDGDIPRATHAYAMLLRAEAGGKGMDIRSSGYWGIGAELLMRGQAGDSKGKRKVGSGEQRGQTSDSEDDEDDEGKRGSERRWGSAAGLGRAKEYFERLFLQHPYIRQYHDSVSALEFWPAMLTCEIYGIQFEHKEELKRIAVEEEKDEGSHGHQLEDSDEDGEDDEARELRRAFSKKEAYWKEKEDIRQKSLDATDKLVKRMDELLTSLPYSDSHVLLRLRGMLSLYLGDLLVPSPPGVEEEKYLVEQMRLGIENRRTRDRKFLLERRRRDHENGKSKQEEERAKAKDIFQRIEREGGRIGIDLRDLSPEPDPEASEDDEDNDGRIDVDEPEPEPESDNNEEDEGRSKRLDSEEMSPEPESRVFGYEDYGRSVAVDLRDLSSGSED